MSSTPIRWVYAALLYFGVLGLVPSFLRAAPQSQEPTGGGGRSNDVASHAISGRASSLNLTYHGGPVQHSQKIYTIFWNPGSSPFPDDYQSKINQFIQDLNGTAYYGIAGQYGDPNGLINTAVRFGGTWLDTSNPFPHSILTYTDLLGEVNLARTANGWTYDLNTYFQVYTPSGITTSLGPNYCGVHWYAYPMVGQIVYNPAHCAPSAPWPNSQAIDAAIDYSAHEIIETVTDPLGNAWYYQNSSGEIGDLCDLNFGPRIGNGSNITLNGHPYIIQREWSNADSTCVMSYTSPPTTFTIADRGGVSLTSGGTGTPIFVGYAEVAPNTGAGAPAGVATFDFRENNILVSEVGVPATPALLSGRIHAEISGTVNAGLAIANPNSTVATIQFDFTDASGNPAGAGTTYIGANQQIAQFLDQSPFHVYSTTTFQGTFSFTSDVPVAVIALRGLTNERGEFLMSTLPVVDTTSPNNGTVVLPHFADGGGWMTQVLMVNPTDNPMMGSLQFADPLGTPVNVTVGGVASSTFSYAIPGRSSQKFLTSGLPKTTVSGSVRINPAGNGVSPTPEIVFSYKPAGVTVSEAGLQATAGIAFRSYVESAGAPGQIGSIDTGIAVANTSGSAVNVTFDVTDLTGSPLNGISPVTLTLQASEQKAKFMSDLFPSLQRPFRGTVRIAASGTLSVVSLRSRINERGDFLISTAPPTDENASASNAPIYFSQIADGGGYTTQFILFSGTPGQVGSGVLKFFFPDGSPFLLPLN
jgi:hypothetical protein